MQPAVSCRGSRLNRQEGRVGKVTTEAQKHRDAKKKEKRDERKEKRGWHGRSCAEILIGNLPPPHPISHISHPALHRFPLCAHCESFASLRLYFTGEEDRKGREGTAKDAKKYFMSPLDILCDLCDTFASLRSYFTGEEDRKGREGSAKHAKRYFILLPDVLCDPCDTFVSLRSIL